MKIAWFKRIISPEIGVNLAGYGLNDKSVEKLDDLYMSGLCADDGENRILIISFDLIGLDEWYTRKIRRACGEILGIAENAVLFTCTHTHSGPESRVHVKAPQQVNSVYLEKLEKWMLK